MAHDATLHVKIDRATNEQLARLAAARKTSKGQLVRDAILACYQVPVNDLPIRQRHALAAFAERLHQHRQAGGVVWHARARSPALALRARHRPEYCDVG